VLLVSRVSGKAMRVSHAATYSGATIAQAGISGSKDQLWRLVDAGSGFVTIVNVNSGKALDTLGSLYDGSEVEQSTPSAGNHNQQWRLTPAGGGYSIVTNRTSGRVLDLRDGGFDDETIIQQWTAFPNDINQQWLVATQV
jgi:glucosylceramidase